MPNQPPTSLVLVSPFPHFFPAIPVDPNMEQIHATYTPVISWSLPPFSENNCPRVIASKASE